MGRIEPTFRAKEKNVKFITLVTVVAVMLIPRVAVADCDHELISALRTKYARVQNQTLAESVFSTNLQQVVKRQEHNVRSGL